MGNQSRAARALGTPHSGRHITCLPLPLLQLHYQHQVVQNLHQLWRQYMISPSKAKEARSEEHLSPKARAAMAQSAYLEKPSLNVESSVNFKIPVLESQQPWQEDSRDFFRSQKTGLEARNFPRKSIMEELLVEGSPDLESAKSPWELDGFPRAEWNLCLEDFRKVPSRALKGLMENGPGSAGCWCSCPEPREGPSRAHSSSEAKKRNLRAWRRPPFGSSLFVSGT